MAMVRRSARTPRAPQRYEPEEVPEDDYDFSGEEAEDDMPGQEDDDTMSQDSGSTGSLAQFVAGDDEIEYETDPDDPDWEEELEEAETTDDEDEDA